MQNIFRCFRSKRLQIYLVQTKNGLKPYPLGLHIPVQFIQWRTPPVRDPHCRRYGHSNLTCSIFFLSLVVLVHLVPFLGSRDFVKHTKNIPENIIKMLDFFIVCNGMTYSFASSTFVNNSKFPSSKHVNLLFS